MKCPNCKIELELVSGKVIYPHRLDLHEEKFRQCPKCKIYIGTRPDGTPLGIPVDKETKKWRIKAHSAFDTLWKSKEFTRTEAYKLLSLRMNMENLHIGNCNIAQCKDIIYFSNQAMQDMKDLNKHLIGKETLE